MLSKITKSLRGVGSALHGRQDHGSETGIPNYVKRYQPLKETLERARRAGLSVGDYIDATFQVPGATQATIDKLAAAGILGTDVRSVCEIGPGSGRYLERIMRRCPVSKYEIYETDGTWSEWLSDTFGVTARNADGVSLVETADCSIDLVHAHKVFVYLPSIVICRYFAEMIRVARAGGKIVFDCMSEACMADTVLEKWIAAGVYYPCMLSREFVVKYFERRGCRLLTSFFAPMLPGESEYLVFEKITA